MHRNFDIYYYGSKRGLVMFNQAAFGEKLKSYRKLNKLTQEDVAGKIGVSGQAVSKWEKGECLPDCYNLKMLGEIYRVSVDALLDTEEIETVDSLTGIYNKRHFLNYANALIEKARRHQKNCYLLSLDFDSLKTLNDTYGHDIGDKALIEFSERIKSGIRSSDLFARYGGDEFMIFMTDTDDIGVTVAAERLRLSICGRNFKYGDADINMTVSIGISKIMDFAMDKAIRNTMEKAISDANDAMYSAKRDGRNKVRYCEQQ